jgi:O-antigen ligase
VADRSPSRPAAQPASGLRAAVERVSVGPLTRLTRLPRALPFLVVLGLLVAGIYVGGSVGAALLAVVVLLIAWLLYLGWPRMTTSERLARTAVLLLAVALCLTQVFPRP